MTTPTYPIVLFDLDHTLFDSDQSERTAFTQTLLGFDVPEPEHHFGAYWSINRSLWARVEAGEIGVADVRVERFRRLNDQAELGLDPEALADRYVVELGNNGELYQGARDVLDEVARISIVALITNGLGEVQRARLRRTGLDQVFHTVVISGEVGVAKPDAGIFDIAFSALDHPDRGDVLMVGDSLTSDMAGGAGYGIATCWLNHGDAPPPDHVTHAIGHLAELPGIVATGSQS